MKTNQAKDTWLLDEFLTVSGNGRTICSIPFDNPKAADDSRLIIAAPELLEACRLAFQIRRITHLDSDELLNKLRTAISKATGSDNFECRDINVVNSEKTRFILNYEKETTLSDKYLKKRNVENGK